MNTLRFVAKALYFAALIVLGPLVTPGFLIPDAPAPETVVVEAQPAPQVPTADRVEAMVERFGCSSEGLPEGVIPASTIVTDTDGTVRRASFDEGWSILQGDRPGTLVAVCLR